jgi:hypothetical protein
VARYSSIGPEWTFVGDLDFVRLYGHALEPWMVMRRQPQKEPILDLDWSSPEIRVGDQPGEWHQEPRLVDTEQGRAADLSGGLTLPFGDLLTVGDGLTLETGFRLRTLEGMPVLVNQGAWPGEGYLLQILGGRLRFHVGGVGSLDCGPEIRTGRWYAVRCTYDGQTLRAYLDGERVGELSSSKAFTPSRRPLRIGRYEDDAATYVVDGLIGRTRIYAAALE